MKPSLIIVVVSLCPLTSVATLAIDDYYLSAPPPESAAANTTDHAERLAGAHTAAGADASSCWEIYLLFDEARDRYPENTDKQIARAVYRVYGARQFWPELTLLESLRLLAYGVPGQKLKQQPGNVTVAADRVYSYLEKLYTKAVNAAVRQQKQLQKAIATRTAAKREETAENQRKAELRTRELLKQMERDRARARTCDGRGIRFRRALVAFP